MGRESGAWFRRALRDPRRGEIGLCAANGAYCLLLSLGPLTALVLSLLPYTPLSEAQVTEAALTVVPAAFRRLLRTVEADVYRGSGAAVGLSLALELWSGARFLASVTRGVAAVTGGNGGALRRRMVGAALTAALLLISLGSVTVLWSGERLLAAAYANGSASEAVRAAAVLLRPVVLWAGLTGANVLLFRCAGGRNGKGLPALLPGAAASAGAWLIFSRGWSWAMERFSPFGVYGSIAAVTISLCWVYGSLYILFLGAWFNTVRGKYN